MKGKAGRVCGAECRFFYEEDVSCCVCYEPECGGIELAVRGGLGAPCPPFGWWAPSLGWRSNRHPASALCGLPFLFLLCGIVAALRLLAVSLGRYVVSSRLFCCPVLYSMKYLLSVCL